MKTGTSNSENENNPEQITEEKATALNVAALLKKVEELTQEVTNLKKSPPGQSVSADAISAAVEGAIRAGNNVKDYNEGIQEEQIPEEDFIPKGVRFCYPSSGHVLSDDIRKGRIVNLPYNKKFIFFECIAERKIQQGKFGEIAYVSAYTSYSKKEVEWIRSHTSYGVVIFESSTEAMNQKAIVASKIAKIMEVVQSYSFVDLLKRCDEYNVGKSEDPAIMRANLAYKMAEASVKQDENATKRLLSENYAQKDLLGAK